MIKIYQKFLAKRFFKNFIILFLALELFFTGIDLMQNFKSLPHSANLQVIYAANKFLSFINYTLPLSLVFAMINTIFSLIKSSELVALYSLGASKKDIIKPIFIISLIATISYILLGFTSFTKADDKAYNIKKYGTLDISTKNLFLKSKDNYIAINELYPLSKRAKNIKIFKTDNGDLKEIIEAKSGEFVANKWQLEDIKQIIKPDLKMPDAKLKIAQKKKMITLEDFNPEVIDNLFKGEGELNIQNSLLAMKMLKNEGIKSDKIRAHLYDMVAFPLFAPIVILGLFYPLPMQRRGSNIALLSSAYIFATLIIWGLIFTMSRIAQNGAIIPEYGILLPIFLLMLGASYMVYKYKNS